MFAPQQLQTLDNAYTLRRRDPSALRKPKDNTVYRNFEGGIRGMGSSETSSSACDTDVPGGDTSNDGGDFRGEVDTVMAGVHRDIKFERRIKELRESKKENAAAEGGATLAMVPPPLALSAPSATAAAEKKPNKIKRGPISGLRVKYAVSAFLAWRCVRLLVCTVVPETRIQSLTVHIAW